MLTPSPVLDAAIRVAVLLVESFVIGAAIAAALVFGPDFARDARRAWSDRRSLADREAQDHHRPETGP